MERFSISTQIRFARRPDCGLSQLTIHERHLDIHEVAHPDALTLGQSQRQRNSAFQSCKQSLACLRDPVSIQGTLGRAFSFHEFVMQSRLLPHESWIAIAAETLRRRKRTECG